MFKDNNILFTIIAMVPALLYSFILLKNLPQEIEFKIKTVIKYLLAGIASAISVLVFHHIFPNWGDVVDPKRIMYSIWFFAFIQVAFLEEFMKFFWFKTTQFDEEKSLKPIQAFYYCVLASVGFAIAENFFYLMSNGPGVLFWRNITAVICHLTTGIIMGYFMALRIQRKEIGYSILGILCATIAHGLYDFNLFVSQFLPILHNDVRAFIFMIVLLQLFLFISSRMVKHLKSLENTKKILLEEYNKNQPDHLD